LKSHRRWISREAWRVIAEKHQLLIGENAKGISGQ
jgi:hypothetical protein